MPVPSAKYSRTTLRKELWQLDRHPQDQSLEDPVNLKNHLKYNLPVLNRQYNLTHFVGLLEAHLPYIGLNGILAETVSVNMPLWTNLNHFTAAWAMQHALLHAIPAAHVLEVTTHLHDSRTPPFVPFGSFAGNIHGATWTALVHWHRYMPINDVWKLLCQMPGVDICFDPHSTIPSRMWFEYYHGVGHGGAISAIAQTYGTRQVLEDPLYWQLAVYAFEATDAHYLAALSVCEAAPVTEVAFICANGVYHSMMDLAVPKTMYVSQDRCLEPPHVRFAFPCLIYSDIGFGAPPSTCLTMSTEGKVRVCIAGFANQFFSYGNMELVAAFDDDMPQHLCNLEYYANMTFGHEPYMGPIEASLCWPDLNGAIRGVLDSYASAGVPSTTAERNEMGALRILCSFWVLPTSGALSATERLRMKACVFGAFFIEGIVDQVDRAGDDETMGAWAKVYCQQLLEAWPAEDGIYSFCVERALYKKRTAVGAAELDLHGSSWLAVDSFTE